MDRYSATIPKMVIVDDDDPLMCNILIKIFKTLFSRTIPVRIKS